jgi:hypothetical protein
MGIERAREMMKCRYITGHPEPQYNQFCEKLPIEYLKNNQSMHKNELAFHSFDE